jgi:hypothetical protein
MKKIILLISISFAFICSFAQKNFQPGTIVTISGETQPGEIDYKNWISNPSTITFRSDKRSPSKSYGVDDLASFEVAGTRYKRAVIDLFNRVDNLNYLSYDDTLVAHTDTVFLLTIISGPKSLYQYIDNVSHFYIGNGDDFEFLQYKKYKVRKEVFIADVVYTPMNQEYVATNRGFVSQLRTYLNDCSINIANDVRYDLDALKSIFASYYDCQGTAPEHKEKRKKAKIELGLLAGVSNTSFDIEKTEIIGRIEYPNSTNFTAGAFADLVFPRMRGRVSFNNELLYSSYETSGQYRYVTSPVTYDDYTYEFGFSYLKLNSMMRYKIYAKNPVIYVNGGVSLGAVLSEVNKVTKTHTFNVDHTTTSGKGSNDTKKYEVGLVAGAGIRVHRASIELRGEYASGPFQGPGYLAKVIRYFAVFGFRIK